MALCRASVVEAQDWIGSPPPPRLMFATAMSLLESPSVRVAVTQSMPQITCDQLPLPLELSTLTAYTLVPGAIPTTPAPVFRAPIVPATWVPCPLSSSALVPGLTQSVPLAAFRSAWPSWMPVSITATFAPLACRTAVLVAAPIRRTPVGAVSPDANGSDASACTVRSGLTNATSGSCWSSSTCCRLSFAAKPLTARR
jgi:hypothetical protein